MAFWAMQHVAARTERALGAALRERDLSLGQFAALITVAENQGLTQQELAARLGLGKANVSQVLDRLEAAGFVQRCPAARAYALHATEAGEHLLAQVVPVLDSLLDQEFSALSGDEQLQLQQLLGRLAT